MINLEKQIECWAKAKYSEVRFDERSIDLGHQEVIRSSFRELGIYDRFMDGHSTENLLRNSASEGAGGLNMSSIFHKLVTSQNINPALYLATYTSEYLKKGLDQGRLPGFLARAMRSFGSFLREPDLAYKLKLGLEKHFSSVEINMDPYQDTKKHVDIEITCEREHVFNIWSYQASQRGLPNTMERLAGKRGEVVQGINILCPLNTEGAKLLIEKKRQYEARKAKIREWQYELVEPNPEDAIGRKQIGYYTIQSFKGLESEVVILADLNDLSRSDALALNYVGGSRAVLLCAAFLSNSVEADYQELAKKLGERMAKSSAL